MPADSPFSFEPVSGMHDLSGFNCGPYAYLNGHLQSGFALRDEQLYRLRTYLMLESNREADDPPTVVGFFALEASRMPTEGVPATGIAEAGMELPGDLPVVYLAMLARDQKAKGRNLGSLLLLEALRYSEAAAKIIGAAGVFLVAVTEEGYRLYRSFNFHDLDGGAWIGANRMFLPMPEVRGLIVPLDLDL